jgi:hypothetical protein
VAFSTFDVNNNAMNQSVVGDAHYTATLGTAVGASVAGQFVFKNSTNSLFTTSMTLTITEALTQKQHTS